MKTQTINVKRGTRFLSELIDRVPSNVLLNKGITGCGGTTVEINSTRNSIILVPIINLIKSKQLTTQVFGVYGDVSVESIKEYTESSIQYKKIMATYDALPKLINIIGESIFKDYFLLIDEYHTFADYYSFRRVAIRGVLNNFNKFENFCFMTATPIKEAFLLKELENINTVEYIWEGASRVNMQIKDTPYVQKELLFEIGIAKDYNLHIFVNSIDFIKRITPNLPHDNFRTVCSTESARKTPQIKPQDINSPICKVNFYTSAAFEGCDIMDENGYTIIVADSNIATTIHDISTSVVQICGRIRNSKYKNTAYLILNTKNHRYLKYRRIEEFEEFAEDNKKVGLMRENYFNTLGADFRRSELRTFTIKYNDIYLDLEGDKLFYDDNLRKLDIRNFNLVVEIYHSTISVLEEINSVPQIEIKSASNNPIDSITQQILNLLDYQVKYSLEEMKVIVMPVFNTNNIKMSDNAVSRYLTPICEKTRPNIKGKRVTMYQLKRQY